MVKRYAAGGASSDTRPVQNAPKVTITPKKPVSKAEAPKAKPAPKPTPKPTAKKPAAKSGSSYSAVKDIKSRMVPKTGVPKPGVGVKATSKPKPATKTPAKTSTKPAAKTVSQLWVEKTGTPWSEAKKQGLSDGSAASNMALMKKLKSGNAMEYTSSGYKIPSEDEARAMDDAYDAAYGPAKTTMRKGGSVKMKMKSKKKQS